MSIEMEIPKVLWLKNNMPKELFDRCKFYDLADALTHIATGNEARSFCSTVCKQGYVPVGVDGSVKGWQEDFLKEIGLEDLTKDNIKRLGGVNRVVSLINFILTKLSEIAKLTLRERMAIMLAQARKPGFLVRRQHRSLAYQLVLLSVVESLTHMLAG